MKKTYFSRIAIIIGLALIMFADGITTEKIIVFLLSLIVEAVSVMITGRKAACVTALLPYCAVMAAGTDPLSIAAAAGAALLSFTAIIYENKTAELEERLIIQRDNDKELAISLQKQNELLIENQDNEVRLATLNERNRIAREIHDNVGHMLSRALIMVGALRTVNKDAAVAEPLGQLEDTLDTAMTQVRASVHDLHDNSVDLSENIREIVSGLRGFETHTDIDCSEDMDRDVKMTLIAVCKEAVSNIIRHSNGDRAEVIVHEQPGFYMMSVSDNGKVSKDDISKAETGVGAGIGLESMRDRVNAMHGTVNFYTDNGFRVYVNIPRP